MTPAGDGYTNLGRRERQIVDVLHRLGRATATDVLRHLPDPPSYSAVRGMLRYLESKGLVTHERDGARYVYRPTLRQDRAQRWAMTHLVRTFFGGSRARAVAALLDLPPGDITDAELEGLTALIRRARGDGK